METIFSIEEGKELAEICTIGEMIFSRLMRRDWRLDKLVESIQSSYRRIHDLHLPQERILGVLKGLKLNGVYHYKFAEEPTAPILAINEDWMYKIH